MLHIKFQGHRSIGSGAERFLKVFTIYGRSNHIDYVLHLPVYWYALSYEDYHHVIWTVWTYSHFFHPWRLYTTFSYNWLSGF